MTTYLDLPGGRLAYDLHTPDTTGTTARGLVIAVPGMGDLRSTYRHLLPELLDAGWRVALVDLRGHGDSAPTFTRYGDEATAGDIVALAETLRTADEAVVVLGNSMAAGAAVIAADTAPDLVAGLVLSGPFVRDPETSAGQRLMMRLVMRPLWIAPVWRIYLPSLFAGRRPDDFDDERGRVIAALRRPGYRRAFAATTRTSHAAAEAALPRLAARGVPMLVLMGRLDPDWPDPVAEAEWIGRTGGAEVVLVEEAGHYPHVQRVDIIAQPVRALLDRVATGRR